jgi:hypothetical protein
MTCPTPIGNAIGGSPGKADIEFRVELQIFAVDPALSYRTTLGLLERRFII